jgi:hypothetical protein
MKVAMNNTIEHPFYGRINYDLSEGEQKLNPNVDKYEPSQFKTPTQTEVVSDFEYYTSAKFLKSASVSIVPVALIGAYSYHKKFSLTKTALLVSIPIVAITGLQYLFMGGGKNKYWSIFSPPSIKANRNAQLREIEKRTGMPQKG